MRTLSNGFPLLDLVYELSFSLAQLQAHPLGASHTKDFADLLARTQKALLRQTELVAALAAAEAKVARADEGLNQLLEQVNLTLLQLTDRKRDVPLYARFFGHARPSEVKRPILGAQLELMHGWLPTLESSPYPELKGLAPPLAAALKAADAAVEGLRLAEQANTDFRQIGECKELIDKVNGTRKATHGKLAEAVHKEATANLATDFAEQFFLRESRWSAPSRDELQARISRSEDQLFRLRAQLAEQDQRRAQAERLEREAQAAALRDEVATIEKRVADEQARAATLKSQLDHLTPPTP